MRLSGDGARIGAWKIAPNSFVWIAAIVLLARHAPTRRSMFDQRMNDEDMGHGFIVPFFVLWIVWREREKWVSVPAQRSARGLWIMAAAAMQGVSVLGGGVFAGSVAFLVPLVGLIAFSRRLRPASLVGMFESLGVQISDAARVARKTSPYTERMEPISLPNGVTLIRDDYNGSIDTLKASLRVLREAKAIRRVLIIAEGKMVR